MTLIYVVEDIMNLMLNLILLFVVILKLKQLMNFLEALH